MPKNCAVPTAGVFGEVAEFWAEIADADATQKQVELVKRLVKPVGLVLDLACGTARHATPLSKAGYDMVGLDISWRLLQIAKHRANEAQADLQLVCADMRFLPFRQGSFSAVVSLDQSLGYLPTADEDALALKEAVTSLQPNGTLLLDLFNGTYMTKHYAKNPSLTAKWALWALPRFPFLAGLFRWHSYPSFWLMYTRNVNPSGVLCDVWIFRSKATGKVSLARHVTRLYDYSQLDGLLGKLGLQVQKVFGGYGNEGYGEDSKRLIVLAVRGTSV